MNIFSLHSNILGDYRDFVRSFFSVADDRAREFMENELRGPIQGLAGGVAPGQPILRPRVLIAQCETLLAPRQTLSTS
jgi:hypothetical protein